MFTGIIETLGTLSRIEPNRNKRLLVIQAPPSFLKGVQIGESIAVEGVCLTVIKKTKSTFSVEAIPETLRDTALSRLTPGKSRLNLEKSLTLAKPVGGHWVFGHVDGVGSIQSIQKREDNYVLNVRAPKKILRQLVPKGSVALDGMSLTLQKVSSQEFQIGIIPHTWKVTSLQFKKKGDKVNCEIDMLYKYTRQALREVGGLA